MQVWPLYLSFDEYQAVICNPTYSGRHSPLDHCVCNLTAYNAKTQI